jgi:hypothetical protein
MPLLDHFHPALFPLRHWESFHGQWAGSLANSLISGPLPPGYFAEKQSKLAAGRVEVDVPTLEKRTNGTAPGQLPAMPLWLRGVPAPVRIDLEATYTEARQRSALA